MHKQLFPYIVPSQHTNLFSPSHTNTRRSGRQCRPICTHKNTDTGEWMCRQAAFISLDCKTRVCTVQHVTPSWFSGKKHFFLEKSQRIKQSLKKNCLLNIIKKMMESRRSDFSTTDRKQVVRIICGKQRPIDWNHTCMSVYMHTGLFCFH